MYNKFQDLILLRVFSACFDTSVSFGSTNILHCCTVFINRGSQNSLETFPENNGHTAVLILTYVSPFIIL